ncbi:MAG: riboflavin synthase [Methylophilaceae bacterium]
MCTGIIQSIGKIASISPKGEDLLLDINLADLDVGDIQIGDSIAVNGVCLTVVALQNGHFHALVSAATQSCTVGLDSSHAVNLEKALRLSDRLGGHIVSGHVDGVGQVIRFEQLDNCWHLSIRAPHQLARYIAVKGSIAVDGVSLTVNEVHQDDFSVNIIPHTLEKTTLSQLGIGSRVNLEVDMLARYIDRMQQWEQENNKS